MNKPPPKIFYTRQPAATMPTIRFKNTGTVVPGSPSNVKRYLQNVKKYHHQQSPSFRMVPCQGSFSEQQSLIEMLKTNEQRLRQRVIELEFENNEYRVMAKDYELLTQRNKQLQQQMVLLLNQLQMKEEMDMRTDSYESSYKNAGSTKERHFTTEQSSPREESSVYPTSFKLEKYLKDQYEKSPFKNIVIQEVDKNSILDDNSFLRNDNQKIKQLINEQIKVSIAALEEKFMGYIRSIEEQMASLKDKNQQIKKIKFKDSSHESQEQKKLQEESKQSPHFTQNAEIIQFFLHSDNGFQKKQVKSDVFRLPSKREYRKASQQISQINIELQSESQYNASFGKSHRRHQSRPASSQDKKSHHSSYIYKSPNYEDFAIEQSEIAFSINPFPDKFTYVVMNRVFQNIETLRGHLTFILAEKSKLTESSIDNFQYKVYKELKNVLQTFFKQKSEADKIGPTESQLISQSNHMKLKIKDLTEQIVNLQQQLKIKVAEQVIISEPKVYSQRAIEEPGSQSLRAAAINEDFIQTERRLIKVIEIMKSFNKEYQDILEQSRVISMHPPAKTQLQSL